MTYDRGVTFAQHVRNINNKAKTRLNVLRALTNTSFGHSKEDIARVYKQYIRPILSYAHTSWQTDLAATHMNRLQTTQNAALRIATGCTASTPVHHLHHETRVLPIRYHLHMRGTHIFSATESPTHPLHRLRSAPARRSRTNPPHQTSAAYYQRELDSIPPLPINTSLRTHIHSVYTQRSLESSQPNTLLGTRPPPVDPELERHLPREDRVHLARLRCGHHTALPSYRHRICPDQDPSCVYCLAAGGTVEHLLLHCASLGPLRDAHGVDTLEHLWERPEEVLNFLRSAAAL